MARCSIQIAFALLLLLQIYRTNGAVVVNGEKKTPLSIAIIGAGASGLTAARHAIAQGHDVTVFEQNEQLGGIWVFDEKVGRNKYGIQVHTAMYKGLRFVQLFLV